MSLRRAIWVTTRSALIGLIVGLTFSGDEPVSIQVWVAATAATIAIFAMVDFLRASALGGFEIAPAWTLGAKPGSERHPRRVSGLRALLKAAQSNPRLFHRRLRPLLAGLAEHFLPRRHGLDLQRDQAEVAALLGSTYWLLDTAVDDRAPTEEEFEMFLELVSGARGRSSVVHLEEVSE